MSDDTPSYIDVRRMLAESERLAQEAAADREQAKRERQAAEYALGQAEHRLRTVEAAERSIAAREQMMGAAGIAALDQRARTAASELAEARQIMHQYDKDRHAAAIALVQINEREKAERAEREQSAAA